MRKPAGRRQRRPPQSTPTPAAGTPTPSGTPAFPWGTPPKPPTRGASQPPLCSDRAGGGRDTQAEQRARERAARPRPPSNRPLPSPSGALVPAPGPGPAGATRWGARYLRVFVEQRQALLGHFEALGQPLAQPIHRLVGGHRQLVAGACRAVDGQAHGRRLGRRAQLAGASGGPPRRQPGRRRAAAPSPARAEGLGSAGAANSRRASGQGGLGERSQTGFLCVPGSGSSERPFGEAPRSGRRMRNQKSEWSSGGRVGSPGRLSRWGYTPNSFPGRRSGKGTREGGAAHPAALKDVCYSGRFPSRPLLKQQAAAAAPEDLGVKVTGKKKL